MRNLFALIHIIIFLGCNDSEKIYKNVTSSEEDINFYELVEVQFKDGFTEGNISIPSLLEKITPIEDNNIFSYQYIHNRTGYLVSIEKLKSRNTQKLSDKEYIDQANYFFRKEHNGNLIELGKLLPPTLRNVEVVQFEGRLKINNKYFMKRVSYYEDKRLDGTALEGVNCTNFHFVTLHNKTKYSFNINYFGNDKGISELIALFNTIGGSINFN